MEERPPGQSLKLASILERVAGPVIIVSSIFFVLRDTLDQEIWKRNPDLFGFWIPNHCFLGRSLAEGHIPEWNPFSMSGVPFASDPQSGWMYLPSMLTYPLMTCDDATRVLIFLYPILAGLGLYAFLRTENLSPTAATVGGLSLGHLIAGSALAVTFSFGPFLAWTALLLACASRFVRAKTWGTCAAWAGLSGLAWGQIAAVHLTNGVVMGTTIFLAYVCLSWIRLLRTERVTARTVAIAGLILLVALVTVNAAFVIPRLAYIQRTNLGLGYETLRAISEGLTGTQAGRPFALRHLTAEPSSIFLMGLSPGAYVGAACLILSLVWPWSKELRPLGILFLAFGGVFFGLSLRVVAQALKGIVVLLPAGDAYLHAPARFFFAVYIAASVLGAVGLEAWIRSDKGLLRLAWLAPGAALWGMGALLAGALPARVMLFAVAAMVAAVLLAIAVKMPGLSRLIPIVVMLELVVNGLVGQTTGRIDHGIAIPSGLPLDGLREETIGLTEYASPPASDERGRSAGPARSINLDNVKARNISRSMIVRAEEVQGYNPFQLRRYWILNRVLGPRFLFKVHSTRITKFVRPPPPRIAELFQVRWMTVPNWQNHTYRRPLGASWRKVTQDEETTLYEYKDPTRRAKLIESWETADTSEEALRMTFADGFDTGSEVVLEEDPGLPESEGHSSGRASFRWLDIQEARITVESEQDALLLIRNPYDPYWRATIDGEDVPLLRANFLFQALPLNSGRHVVSLRYDDPWIERGLTVSGAAVGLILGALLIGRRAPVQKERS